MPLRHHSVEHAFQPPVAPDAGATQEQRFLQLQLELRDAYTAMAASPHVDKELFQQVAAFAFEIMPAEALLKDDLPVMEELVVRVRDTLGSQKTVH